MARVVELVGYLGDYLVATATPQLVMLNKPTGYVCSRTGQESKTVYDFTPELHRLKPVGRLDKDSSGLLLLANDGQLAHELTHPSFHKEKIYEIELDKQLADEDRHKLEQGIQPEDGPSTLRLDGANKTWRVVMHEGRNRQIRRTFAALDYTIARLHHTNFGSHELGSLPSGALQDTTFALCLNPRILLAGR